MTSKSPQRAPTGKGQIVVGADSGIQTPGSVLSPKKFNFKVESDHNQTKVIPDEDEECPAGMRLSNDQETKVCESPITENKTINFLKQLHIESLVGLLENEKDHSKAKILLQQIDLTTISKHVDDENDRQRIVQAIANNHVQDVIDILKIRRQNTDSVKDSEQSATKQDKLYKISDTFDEDADFDLDKEYNRMVSDDIPTTKSSDQNVIKFTKQQTQKNASDKDGKPKQDVKQQPELKEPKIVQNNVQGVQDEP